MYYYKHSTTFYFSNIYKLIDTRKISYPLRTISKKQKRTFFKVIGQKRKEETGGMNSPV